MRVRRIVLAGDVLHPDGEGTGDWLRRLLGGLVAEASGLPVEPVGPGTGFDADRAYALWGAERSWPGWAAIADAAVVPTGVPDLFEAAFGEAVVLGFGMAEVTKRMLSHLGIAFMDLVIHPVRFLDDLFFAVQTNDADVFAAMLPYHAEGGTFRAAAGLVAAAVRDDTPGGMHPPTLLIGQRATDPALLRDGILADFSCFPAAVRAAAGPGGVVAFRPDPAEPGDLGLFAAGLTFTSLRLMRGDLCALLASGRFRRVVGLSSPVLTEARYFGCETEYLLGDPLDLADRAAEAEPGQFLSVVDGAFEADFWRQVLAPLVAVTAPDGTRWRRPPNSLRLALRRLRPDLDAAPSLRAGPGSRSEALRDDPAEAEA